MDNQILPDCHVYQAQDERHKANAQQNMGRWWSGGGIE
jgi:hypothetical protein